LVAVAEELATNTVNVLDVRAAQVEEQETHLVTEHRHKLLPVLAMEKVSQVQLGKVVETGAQVVEVVQSGLDTVESMQLNLGLVGMELLSIFRDLRFVTQPVAAVEFMAPHIQFGTMPVGAPPVDQLVAPE